MVRMDGSSRCNSSARWRSQSPMPGSIKLGPQIRTSVRPSLGLPSSDIGYQGYHGCQECGWLMLRTLPPWPEILTHHLSGLALQACAEPWCLEHGVEKSGSSWNLEKRDSSSSVAVSSCPYFWSYKPCGAAPLWHHMIHIPMGHLTCRSCNASPSP